MRGGDALVLPRSQLSAGGIEHPLSERYDKARPLGDRYEDRRRNTATGGMVPAQQRLDPNDPARYQLYLRLVEKLQLAAVERAAQFVGNLYALKTR